MNLEVIQSEVSSWCREVDIPQETLPVSHADACWEERSRYVCKQTLEFIFLATESTLVCDNLTNKYTSNESKRI